MNKKFKTLFVGTIIFVIVIVCVAFISFFLKDNNNFSSFIGSILGALISGVITFVGLYITIKQGNENQSKALNLQSALQVENNLLHFLEKQKKNITESVNKLDKLLFTVQLLKIANVKDIPKERKNLINIFSDYRQAMNSIRFATNIYIDTSKCDGCTDCCIKSYGELSKRKTKLSECFYKIELNCNVMMQALQIVLDKSIDIQQWIEQKTLYFNQKRLNEEGILKCRNSLSQNSNDIGIMEKIRQYETENIKLEEQIRVIDEQIQQAFNEIGEENKKARNEANNIHMRDRNELHNAIMQYFDIYNFYIEENKKFTLKNGILFNKKCKKYASD
ncbi:MAG: hypothetical protein K1W39_17530 [Lachnospiraceae bacterium]